MSLFLLALSEGATVAIAVAFISAVGSGAAAYAAVIAKRTEGKLGTPNGHGDVSTMLGTLIHQQTEMLDGQTGQDARLAQIEHRMSKGDERMIRLGTRLSSQGDQLDSLTRRVGRIETSCQFIASHVHDEDDAAS